MAKLPARHYSVNPSLPPISSQIRRRINTQAHCPWCGAAMYLSRNGRRLLCVDVIHCAGVKPYSLVLKVLKEVA